MSALYDYLTSAEVMITIVWSGMAILTISLIVLMRTRWGHQQPLRKCVVLSLFAHVLFAAYATTVHIVRTHPHPGHSWAMRITELVDGTMDGAATGVKDGNTELPSPWDQAVTTPVDPQMIVQPEMQSEPPVGLTEDLIPSSAASATESAAAATLAEVAAEAYVVPSAEAATPAPATAAPAAPIEVAAPDKQTNSPAGPQAAELDHLAEAAAVLAVPAALANDLKKPASQTPAVMPDRPIAQQNDGLPGDDASLRASVPAPPDPVEAGQLVAVLPRETANSDIKPEPALEAPAPERNAAPHELPELYRGRTPEGRQRAAASYGGSADTEASVNAALEWLVRHQSADGRWDASDHGAGRETLTLGQDRKGAGAQADTGLTGLALLAFLGAGHTHQAGPHIKTVQRGIDYLLAAQAADGNLAGEAEIYAYMYCHGMATLALSEAYAMTGDARLARPVRRAIGYTVSAQNLASGGWRYKPPYSRDRGDTSQLGWQLMSLKSAEQSGIAIPERTRQGIVRYLNSVSSGARGGLAAYRPDERATHPMTAEALVCREFLGLSLPGAAQEAGDYLLGQSPGQGPPNFYYWYYGTLAMFQMQGDHWAKWNQAMSVELTRSQRADGDTAGSWDPDPLWGGYGGRVFSTSLGALCLEVYYRYLPLYTVTAGREKSAK